MHQRWFQQVGSAVPRGFSRYYILESLKDESLSGKEIIDHATRQTSGVWKTIVRTDLSVARQTLG